MRIIFLHIPKTAGIAFGKIIKYNYGFKALFNKYFLNNRYYYINLPGVQFKSSGTTSNYVDFIKSIPKENLKKNVIIKGHINFGVHKYFPDKSTYITFLRDPIDRVISLYFYIKRSKGHPHFDIVHSHKMTLKDFVNSGLTTETDNAQTRMLAGEFFSLPFGKCTQDHLEMAKSNLTNYFDAFGLTERFDESLLLMKKIFGWSFIFSTKENVTKNRLSKDEVTHEDLLAIEANNKLDIELYDFAMDIFNKKLKERSIDKSNLSSKQLASIPKDIKTVLGYLEKIASYIYKKNRND